LALHFAWLWPSPLGKLPAGVKWTAYSAALLVFAGKTAGVLRGNEFIIGPALETAAILVLLGLHVILQPASRRSVGSLLILVVLAVLPVTAYPLLEHRISLGLNDLVTSLGLPLIPLAYSFSAYRRNPGTVEMRWNTMAVAYAFLFVSGIVMAPLLAVIASQATDQVATLGLAAVTGVTSALAGIFAYPSFKSFFERRVLGQPIPPGALVRDYVRRITITPSTSRLTALLEESILPSLLVRQFLFVRLDTAEPEIVLAVGIRESEVPSAAELLEMAGQAGGNHPDREGRLERHPWVRLVLTLTVEDDKLGLWLLGRRDPDDQYLDREIAIIRSLADQTAIVLSHSLQTQRLRELYQADVKRNEDERMQLALALHDRVLNQLAALMMKMEDAYVTPDLLKLYEQFSSRVRNLVSELRPPMLEYGLLPGLKELAERLQEQADPAVRISADGVVGEARYAPQVELHLYRIVQESCENALQHGHAASIDIGGRLDPDDVQIEIQDDGAGFEMRGGQALGRLIARKHFGLAGMIERANLIGGSVDIRTAPGQGTRIKAIWSARSTGALPHITS
jgi:signal transduction histidine kinase